MSEIKNRKTLCYELGVLMFNLVAEHPDSLCFTNEYDGIGNFVSLFNAIGNIELDELKEGFLAECQNYSISKEEAEQLFQKTKDRIINY